MAPCLALAAAAALVSCATLEETAPSVGTLPGGESGLAEGRELYLGKCAKCHAPEPITDYSAVEWDSILPDMAGETNLTARETQALERYIAAVLGKHPG